MARAMKTIYAALSRGEIEQRLLVLLAISLPFEYLPSFNLSQFTIRPSVLIGLVLVAILVLRFFQGKIKIARLQYILIIWLLWLGLGLLYGENIAAGLKILLPLGFLSLVALAVGYLTKKEYLKPIIYGVLAGTALSVIFGIWQYAGNIIGLPESVTGLRPEYGWQGFGFPNHFLSHPSTR